MPTVNFINASDRSGPIRVGFVRSWDLHRLDAAPILVGQLEGLESVMAFSPDGKFLASATNERGVSPDMAVRLWDLSHPSRESITLGHAQGMASSIAYSNDGQMLALGGESGKITLWDPEADRAIIAPRGYEAGGLNLIRVGLDRAGGSPGRAGAPAARAEPHPGGMDAVHRR